MLAMQMKWKWRSSICNWRSGALLRNSADDAQLFCGGRVQRRWSALFASSSSSVPTTCFHFRSLFCSFWLLCKLYHCKELYSYTANGFPFRGKSQKSKRACFTNRQTRCGTSGEVNLTWDYVTINLTLTTVAFA